jgi:metal-responsive CopG/Arc/MetJ family transcriptional regulator
MKKIIVSLPDGIVETLDKELIGKIGETRSDTLRTIIQSWMSEQGYLAKGDKEEEKDEEALFEAREERRADAKRDMS